MKLLSQYLIKKSQAELAGISLLWEANIDTTAIAGIHLIVARELLSEFLQRRVLEKLNPPQVKLLQYFTRQPGVVLEREKVYEEFPAGNTPEIIKQLLSFGLLYEEGFAEGPERENPFTSEEVTGALLKTPRMGWKQLYGRPRPGQVGSLPKNGLLIPRDLGKPMQKLVKEFLDSSEEIAGPRPSQFSLQKLLETLEPEILEGIIESWGIYGLHGETKSKPVAEELAGALNEEYLQQRVLEILPPESVTFFKKLKRKGGKISFSGIREEFITLKRAGPVLRPLIEVRLVWEAFENKESIVFIPAEIANPNKKAGPPEAIQVQTVSIPVNAGIYPSYALAWDILTFLNFITQNEINFTTSHTFPKQQLKKLLRLLWVKEDADEAPRFGWLLSLSRRLELFESETYSRLMSPGPALKEWLKLDFYQQQRVLFEAWLKSAGIFSPVSFSYRSGFYLDPPLIEKINRTILSWLNQFQPGVWYSFPALVNKIRLENPFFIHSRRDLVAKLGLTRFEEYSRGWNQGEGRIIHDTFRQPLAWLGIIQVSLNEENKLEAFSVTELGADLASGVKTLKTPSPRVDKPIVMQPNFDILLFSPEVQTLWTLFKFTRLTRLDQVSIFSLDKSTVLKGLEAGLTTAEILAWLQEQNPQPLPQNVVVSIEDWSRGYKHISVDKVVLLEVVDPGVLDEIEQSKQFGPLIDRRLSPTLATIKVEENPEFLYRDKRNDPVKKLRDKIKANGYFLK